MPGAPSSAQRSRARATSARSRTRTRGHHPPARVRWDRIARVVMLMVLSALLYLYISAGTSYLSTWHQASKRRAEVATMQRENDRLRAQRASLTRSTTVEAEARRLGMIRPGERTYIIQGLPAN